MKVAVGLADPPRVVTFQRRYRNKPVLRKGGVLILTHPCRYEFDAVQHPSYIDYYDEVLADTTDLVEIEKGGDVIPKVNGFVREERPKNSKPYHFPELCPCPLKTVLHRPPEEANHFCEHAECPWQIRGRIQHFASRAAMDRRRAHG